MILTYKSEDTTLIIMLTVNEAEFAQLVQLPLNVTCLNWEKRKYKDVVVVFNLIR